MLTSYRLGFLTTVNKDLNKINKNNSIFRIGGSNTQLEYPEHPARVHHWVCVDVSYLH